jgi:hypothetical protein
VPLAQLAHTRTALFGTANFVSLCERRALCNFNVVPLVPTNGVSAPAIS